MPLVISLFDKRSKKQIGARARVWLSAKLLDAVQELHVVEAVSSLFPSVDGGGLDRRAVVVAYGVEGKEVEIWINWLVDAA